MCFVGASANMQSVSTHLHMSVASAVLGNVSVSIGARMASLRRLLTACRSDAIVVPKRLSANFPTVGRRRRLRALSESVTRHLRFPLPQGPRHEHVRHCGSQVICGFDAQLHLVRFHKLPITPSPSCHLMIPVRKNNPRLASSQGA